MHTKQKETNKMNKFLRRNFINNRKTSHYARREQREMLVNIPTLNYEKHILKLARNVQTFLH